jgi:putative cell wall-binding protein
VSVSSSRLSGTDRFDTAAQVYSAAFGCAVGGVRSAVLARGDAFADALAGSYLAGSLDSGVLLTGTASVPPATLAALRASGVQQVQLLGGTAAISDAVAAALARTPSYACDGTPGAPLEVVRVAGGNRFDTARRTAESAGTGAVGTLDLGAGARRTAVLASGLGFADALAAGPLSYAGAVDPARGSGRGFPTLLTAPDALAPEARAALTSLGVQQVVVPGGAAVVSPAVVAQVEAMGIRVVRLAGANRSETAALVAAFAVERLGFERATVTLARGDAFADALAGAAFAGDAAVPLLLTAGPTTLGPATRSYLQARVGVTTGVTAFGGDGAISAATLAEAVSALAS